MTTADVRELRRLSPHGIMLVASPGATQTTAARGQNLGGRELTPHRAGAARESQEPRR
jgi:hypothetical protein